MPIIFNRSCTSNQFTSEIENLQSKCNANLEQADIREADLVRLQAILRKSQPASVPLLEGKKIDLGICQKNVNNAIQVALLQKWMPNLLDAKDFNKILAGLFAYVSGEIYKYKLESTDKKLARKKRFETKKVEKSQKGQGLDK